MFLDKSFYTFHFSIFCVCTRTKKWKCDKYVFTDFNRQKKVLGIACYSGVDKRFSMRRPILIFNTWQYNTFYTLFNTFVIDHSLNFHSMFD